MQSSLRKLAVCLLCTCRFHRGVQGPAESHRVKGAVTHTGGLLAAGGAGDRDNAEANDDINDGGFSLNGKAKEEEYVELAHNISTRHSPLLSRMAWPMTCEGSVNFLSFPCFACVPPKN